MVEGMVLFSVIFVLGILSYTFIKHRLSNLSIETKSGIFKRTWRIVLGVGIAVYLGVYGSGFLLFIIAFSDFAELKIMEGIVNLLASIGLYKLLRDVEPYIKEYESWK